MPQYKAIVAKISCTAVLRKVVLQKKLLWVMVLLRLHVEAQSVSACRRKYHKPVYL